MAKKKYKAKAWSAFSKYIRLRDAILTTGGTEYATCVTCGKTFGVGKLHAGHFLPGRTNGILFDERGVHAQCVGCNIYGNGRQAEYYLWMMERYGPEVIDELAHAKVQSLKLTEEDYRMLEQEYRRRAAAILASGEVEESWGEPFVDTLKAVHR